jgi:bifunctional UDP-N-acetylglucosamine pyrophosphorylase / glucosamine-1-phosphate N-acetyltransferase
MRRLNVVLLAAGKGERMVSKQPKVMHEIMGKPMIGYVIDAARSLKPTKIIAVLGYGRTMVEDYLKKHKVHRAIQHEQKGTAHALLTAEELVREGDVLVLYGDVPLISPSTLQGFLKSFKENRTITFMTTDLDDPSGYGRVILEKGEIKAIVEDHEATPRQKMIRTINTGICLIPKEHFALLKSIRNDNKKGEFYLTDIVTVGRKKGITVLSYSHPSSSEVLGINNRRELLEANRLLRRKIVDSHLAKGVTILDQNVYIEDGVTIGMDTVIYPNVFLMGATHIGESVSVGPYVMIKDSTIGDRVSLDGFIVMEGAQVSEGVKVGPFSRIRHNTVLKQGVRVGNFVEVKNSVLSEDVRANHLAYIGDAYIGKGVNIGAGTITCNYDGRKKHRTVIEDNVFVGSNTSLVAPLTIGKDASIGAGSTITKDVPEGALAVGRAPQKIIKGYGRRKRCAE